MLRLAFVGCSKTKMKGLRPEEFVAAGELYQGPLFKSRKAVIETRGIDWFILSASGGLLKPTSRTRTYDKTMASLSEIERAEWASGVVTQLMETLYYDHQSPSLKSVTIELHAGKLYREPLATWLKSLGIKVEVACEGKGIGEQLKHYKHLQVEEVAT